MVLFVLSEPKSSRKMTGNANVKPADAGLRQ